jgi:hypothetical protein
MSIGNTDIEMLLNKGAHWDGIQKVLLYETWIVSVWQYKAWHAKFYSYSKMPLKKYCGGCFKFGLIRGLSHRRTFSEI